MVFIPVIRWVGGICKQKRPIFDHFFVAAVVVVVVPFGRALESRTFPMRLIDSKIGKPKKKSNCAKLQNSNKLKRSIHIFFYGQQNLCNCFKSLVMRTCAHRLRSYPHIQNKFTFHNQIAIFLIHYSANFCHIKSRNEQRCWKNYPHQQQQYAETMPKSFYILDLCHCAMCTFSFTCFDSNRVKCTSFHQLLVDFNYVLN